MIKEIRTKWLEDLRSGKYQQTQGRLCKDGTAFCCLGVLAEQLIERGLLKRNNDYTYYNHERESPLEGELNQAVRDVISLRQELEEELIDMNDNKKCNFEEIANFIEKEVYEEDVPFDPTKYIPEIEEDDEEPYYED